MTVVQRIGNWFRAGRRRAELNRMDPGELNRVAGEIGVSVQELALLAAEGPDRSRLLQQRLKVLDVDISAIARKEPAVLRDMERVCSHCGDRLQCERDLAADEAGTRWQGYCPNAETIQEFRKN